MVSVISVTTMTSVHVMTSMHIVTRMHVVTAAVVEVVRPTGCTAIVPVLAFANQVVLLIALALVRRAVTFFARVVITDTHHWVW